MLRSKEHARELLAVFERYAAVRPDIVADQRGLRAAKELVRLMDTDEPDRTSLEALRTELEDWPDGAGTAWADLQLCANYWMRSLA